MKVSTTSFKRFDYLLGKAPDLKAPGLFIYENGRERQLSIESKAMTLQTLKIGKQEYVLLAKRDFQKLAAQAERQTEDDYWTEAALKAEAAAKAKGEKPIPFEQIERELDARKLRGGKRRARR